MEEVEGPIAGRARALSRRVHRGRCGRHPPGRVSSPRGIVEGCWVEFGPEDKPVGTNEEPM